MILKQFHVDGTADLMKTLDSFMGARTVPLAEAKVGHLIAFLNAGGKIYPQVPQKQEEANMYAQIQTSSPEQDARAHLRDRLRTVKYETQAKLRKDFGLDDDEAPRTPKELAERLASGKFIVKHANDEKQPSLYSVSSYIRWRDPAVKEDQAGYDKAKEKLSKAYTEAKDVIIVKSPEEGLKALQGFEKAKFQ